DRLTRVVDQYADQAEALPCLVEGGLHVGALGNVARDETDAIAAAQFIAGFLQRSLAATHEGDARALRKQAARHRQADAARRAGYQGVARGFGRAHEPTTCSA